MIIAAAGAIHFVVALFFWGCMLAMVVPEPGGLRRIDWAGLWPAFAAIVFFVVFLTVIVMAWRRRKSAIVLLALAIAGATASFFYDTSHNRYQIQVMTIHEGCKHVYFNWWWYDDD